MEAGGAAALLLLVAAGCWGVTGVHIDAHSALVQTVRVGEEADLYCESSAPYQWCYWMHNDIEYPTTAKGVESTPWGFQWKKTAHRCGIHFQSVAVSQAGSWKCHLANTDAVEVDSIRDERWLELEVGQPGAVELVAVPASLSLTWGEGLELTCTTTSQGWPPPDIRLVRDNRGGERKELASGANISLTYLPDIAEDGAIFRCLWVQEREGLLLYSGEEVSPPLEMVIVPATLANTQTFYVFQNVYEEEDGDGEEQEPLLIRVEFLAKPWPNAVTWYRELTNGTRLPLEEEEEEEGGLTYLQGGVEAVGGGGGGGGQHLLATTLTIANLTHNISLVLEISNKAGTSHFYFTVEVPPPPPPPPATLPPPSTAYLDLHSLVSPEVYRTNLTAGSIAGLVGGLLFGLLLLLLSLLLCRPRRGEQTSKQGREESSGWLEKEYPLLIPDTANSSSSNKHNNGNSSPLPMSTFGKDARSFNGALYGDSTDGTLSPVKTDLELILPSPSSVSTDDLSSLGVRLKEFPDPLASWEDLEPDFNKRRSRHIDSELTLSPNGPNGANGPSQPLVRLSGPTGYPVTIQSPRHAPQPSPRHSQFDVSLPSPRHQSPHGTIQKLHLHVPAERDMKV